MNNIDEELLDIKEIKEVQKEALEQGDKELADYIARTVHINLKTFNDKLAVPLADSIKSNQEVLEQLKAIVAVVDTDLSIYQNAKANLENSIEKKNEQLKTIKSKTVSVFIGWILVCVAIGLASTLFFVHMYKGTIEEYYLSKETQLKETIDLWVDYSDKRAELTTSEEWQAYLDYNLENYFVCEETFFNSCEKEKQAFTDLFIKKFGEQPSSDIE